MNRFKVVQWATGGMGRPCLRAILDDPRMELVGLYVYSDDKVGKDGGELARMPPCGVKATNRIEDILTLDADVVVHCARIGPRYGLHDEEIIRLLASGKNVISINGYSHPGHWRDERSARLSRACEEGRSSLMAAGLNPGHVGEQLAVVASGACLALDCIQVVESTSVALVPNREYVFGALGFGADPATINPNDPNWGPAAPVNGMYTEVLAAMAARIGLELDAVVTDHVAHGAPHDVEIRAGRISQGMVSHLNYRWHGLVQGQRRLSMSIHWFAEPSRLERPNPPLWAITVKGHPSVRLEVDFEKHPDDHSRMAPEQLALAGMVMNSVAHVVNAPPGFVMRPMTTPFSGGVARLMRVPSASQ